MSSPTMLWASHHCTLGAGVGVGGGGTGPDWTKLSRLGLHFLSALETQTPQRSVLGGF